MCRSISTDDLTTVVLQKVAESILVEVTNELSSIFDVASTIPESANGLDNLLLEFSEVLVMAKNVVWRDTDLS